MKLKILGLLFCFLATPVYATVDESDSLIKVLEFGSLSKKDCDDYHKGKQDNETMMRCGKWMFFYDSMNRPGFPAPIVDLLFKHAPQTVGPHGESLGLIADPFSKNGLPVGLTPAPKLPGGVKTYSMTCANCHFSKLPDGRYKVGQPNSNFDYPGLVFAVSVLPQMALQPKKVLPPTVKAKMQPMIDEFFGAKWSRLSVILQTLRLIPSALVLGQKPMSDKAMEELASMPRGVLDPIAFPSMDDGYHIPLRILPLWGLTTPETMVAAGSQHGSMLTSAGGTSNLAQILHTGALLVDGVTKTHLADEFDANYYKPLYQYIYSLKAPKNSKPADPSRIEEGARVFQDNCASCHNGPGYAGTKVYMFDEIGTDPQLANIFAPEGNVTSHLVEASEITHGVRAPRLEGWWSMSKLLHNGSVQSLGDLLCIDGPRSNVSTPGHSNQGHEFGCDTFTVSEKEALIHFLESL